MAVKDKVVTLEDLKAAYDDLKEKMGAWEDITSSLTWVDDTSSKPMIGMTERVLNKTAKKATLSVSPGDRYRVTAYCPKFESGSLEGTSPAVSFIDDRRPAIVYGGENFKLSPDHCIVSINGSSKLVFASTHKEFIVRIPKYGVSSIDIYDYDTNHGIIVEKEVTD